MKFRSSGRSSAKVSSKLRCCQCRVLVWRKFRLKTQTRRIDLPKLKGTLKTCSGSCAAAGVILLILIPQPCSLPLHLTSSRLFFDRAGHRKKVEAQKLRQRRSPNRRSSDPTSLLVPQFFLPAHDVAIHLRFPPIRSERKSLRTFASFPPSPSEGVSHPSSEYRSSNRDRFCLASPESFRHNGLRIC